jgi:hypothetical protein
LGFSVSTACSTSLTTVQRRSSLTIRDKRRTQAHAKSRSLRSSDWLIVRAVVFRRMNSSSGLGLVAFSHRSSVIVTLRRLGVRFVTERFSFACSRIAACSSGVFPVSPLGILLEFQFSGLAVGAGRPFTWTLSVHAGRFMDHSHPPQ